MYQMRLQTTPSFAHAAPIRTTDTLSAEWGIANSGQHGKTYYDNTETQVSVWTLSEALQHQADIAKRIRRADRIVFANARNHASRQQLKNMP